MNGDRLKDLVRVEEMDPYHFNPFNIIHWAKAPIAIGKSVLNAFRQEGPGIMDVFTQAIESQSLNLPEVSIASSSAERTVAIRHQAEREKLNHDIISNLVRNPVR